MLTRSDKIRIISERLWYRLVKVLSFLVVFAAFVAPFFYKYDCARCGYICQSTGGEHHPVTCSFSDKVEQGIIIDVLINGLSFLLLMYLGRETLLYVVFGSVSKSKEEPNLK